MKSSDFNEMFEKAEGIVQLLEGISSRFPNFQYVPEFAFFPEQKKMEVCAWLSIIYSASNSSHVLEVTTRTGHSQLKAVINGRSGPLISSEVQEQINCVEKNTELSDRVAEILARNSAVSGSDYVLVFEGLDLLKFDRKPHSFRGWTGGYMAYPELYGKNKLFSPEMDLAMDWQAGDQFANILTRIHSLRKLYCLLLENLKEFNLQEKMPEIKDKMCISQFKQVIDSGFCSSFLEYKRELDSLFKQDFSPVLKSSGMVGFDSKKSVSMGGFQYSAVSFRIAQDYGFKDKYTGLLRVCHQFSSDGAFEKAKKKISRYGLGEETDYVVREYDYKGSVFKVIRRICDNFFVIELEKAMEDKNALFDEMRKSSLVIAEFYKKIK